MADYDVAEAFAAIEDELISSMIRNMKRHRIEENTEKKRWEMWQAMQLQALEEYKKINQAKFSSKFFDINSKIANIISKANQHGGMEQEIKILDAIKKGFMGANKISEPMAATFFKLNKRKLDALITATVSDMKKAETAVLRMADDQYRKIIFNAQMYANTGAGTYEKAVDMASKDFLSAGLNCVQYKNGARHTISDYADMAIRTASKRAYLQGEGMKRQEWGLHLVIMNKRGNPCPKCLPFCGKILIDDVWSGGSSKDGDYPLMSTAIAAGLYHPRCKDTHTTYFPGITTADGTWTRKELEAIGLKLDNDQKMQYAERQVEKYGRLAKHSLDEENKRRYRQKVNDWKFVAKAPDSGIIKPETTKEVVDVHSVGKIDKNMYKCITDDIKTDEVIITDERITHIIERRGRGFYDRYGNEFADIIRNPDYIFEDKANTALVCKEFIQDGKFVNVVLRIAVSTDDSSYKNSIITAVGESRKRFQQRLRNNDPLYKKE